MSIWTLERRFCHCSGDKRKKKHRDKCFRGVMCKWFLIYPIFFVPKLYFTPLEIKKRNVSCCCGCLKMEHIITMIRLGHFSVVRLVLFSILHNYLLLLYCPCVCHWSITFSPYLLWVGLMSVCVSRWRRSAFIGSTPLPCLSHGALSPAVNRIGF